MKTLVIAFTLFATMSMMGTTSVSAQDKKTTSAQTLLSTLSQTAVQGGLINVGNVSVDVSNITVQDLVTVQSVLNNANIEILNNSLNNNKVLNDLTVTITDLLRNANILNKNQIIIGILSNQGALQFVTQNVKSMK
jgi:hypothetical protein